MVKISIIEIRKFVVENSDSTLLSDIYRNTF